jgi:hypothetical protein
MCRAASLQGAVHTGAQVARGHELLEHRHPVQAAPPGLVSAAASALNRSQRLTGPSRPASGRHGKATGRGRGRCGQDLKAENISKRIKQSRSGIDHTRSMPSCRTRPKTRSTGLVGGVGLSYTNESHAAEIQHTMRTPPPPPPPLPLPKDSRKSQEKEVTLTTASPRVSITKDEEAIVMFLGKFRDKPMRESDIGYFGSNPGWAEVLKIDPHTLTQKFKEAGLVCLLSVESDIEIMLNAFQTVASLRNVLREIGCKKTGNKAELVRRLAEFSKDEAAKLIPQEACWGTTSKGAELVDDYRSQKKSHQEELEDRILALVLNKLHDQASRLIADYNSKQVFPPGLGCSWTDRDTSHDVNILDTIRGLTPNILAGNSTTELEPARIIASLEYLFGSCISSRLNGLMIARLGIRSTEEKQHLDLQARDLLSYAYGKTSLDEWKRRSVLFVRISGCGADSCEACQSISQQKYSISEIPQLPHEKCTNPAGCRCCYVPA